VGNVTFVFMFCYMWYYMVLTVRCFFLWSPVFLCVGMGSLWVLCFLSSFGYVQRGVIMTSSVFAGAAGIMGCVFTL
jgi:hypothetical protein